MLTDELFGRKVYSKVDWWFWLMVVAFAFFGARWLASGWRLVGAALSVLEFGVLLPTLLDTWYRLEEGGLHVKSWLRCNLLIPYETIDAVTPTRASAPGPALSSDRLEICFTHQGQACRLLISPAQRALFEAALRRRLTPKDGEADPPILAQAQEDERS